MFDHIGTRVADPERSLALQDALLATLNRTAGHAEGLDREWEDWCVSPTDAAHPVATSGLHVGFSAESRAMVDAFHAAGLAHGAADDGAPGERDYAPGYYGAFLRDFDGNSLEAVFRGQPRDALVVDHAWLRFADHAAVLPFYRLLAEHAGLEEIPRGERWTLFRRGHHSFSIVADDRPVTRGLHFALPAPEATVRAWHAAAVAAGFQDNGAPGFRPYHEGYYGAFVLDPAGQNVELVDHHR